MSVAAAQLSAGAGRRDAAPPRPRRARLVWAASAIAAIVLFSGLGVWQLERRAWKRDLIAQVEQRVHAPAVPAPGRASWPHIAARDAYRHVTAKGRFLDVRPALAQAVTVRGGGFWVIAPFRMDDGAVVMVNRGFVPADRSGWPSLAPPPGVTEITGLLRVSEPGGGFLRHNDPAADRWYSRDVAAIAHSRGLDDVAPYFIDAEAAANDPDRVPIGGLTVISFPDNHLVYALTWFALATMSAYALIRLYVGRAETVPEPGDRAD